MNFFRRINAFSAILAITAWANVQVMACCWSFSGSHKAVAKIETAQMEPGHACCHKHPAEGIAVPVSAGTVALHATHAGCGGQHDAPGLQSQAPSLDLISIANVQFVSENQFLASSSFPATPVRDTGPPRYLALQRFLI